MSVRLLLLVPAGRGAGGGGKLREWAAFEFGRTTCRDCILNTVKLYESNTGHAVLTVEGRDPDGPRTALPDELPDGAKPDCNTCEKPDLDPSNFETLDLYSLVHDQQRVSEWSGARLGLRLEAVIAGLNELCREGRITDRARALRRVFVLDRAVNQVLNAKLPKPTPPS